ncbi:putative transcription factor VLTF3 [Chlorella virus XW01]|nr:putative transcription factor VLTF3 [Chlorella virus XW01]
MSNFRIQRDKKIKTDIVGSTLDKKHKEKTEYFKTLNDNKNNIINQLNIITNEINEINNKFYLEQKDIDKKRELNDNKEKLEEELLEYNNSEINYYDNVGDLITKYYQDNENESDTRSKSILDLFNNNQKTSSEKKGKIEIYEKFCNRVDGLRLEKDDGSNRIKYCDNCKIEKFLDVGKSSYICPECGEMEKVLIDEDNIIKEYSCYKRLSHFKEWLTQIQAKESPDIDDETFEMIVKEINKQKITDIESISNISRDIMQKILFKLGKSHLYEHIPYIINKLCGKPPPKILPDIENKFYQMFMQIQEPWELYKPEGRKNIIQYSYIIYKFCELLELDELLPYFPLLKSPKKLMEHDKIWKKFCDYLKWDFYPTEI